MKTPFEFLGDACDAITGQNGSAGALVDKHLPIRPAYRHPRAHRHQRPEPACTHDATHRLPDPKRIKGSGN
ncbi:hypothetical protein ACIOMQ_41365 [Streptomyces sp. NPDC087845]|uniref:hypothetical protein n=1 Tax=Streptomyces sp. NPDC087845 TaxID=3365806 RepID=UPI00381C45EC